ncbi:hypothetical protein GCM10010869_58990 [Mesorhizobium tianshanense]|nr:hypothetical protein GCM10010869_58990 [Mesorhizobium tianshanense]
MALRPTGAVEWQFSQIGLYIDHFAIARKSRWYSDPRHDSNGAKNYRFADIWRLVAADGRGCEIEILQLRGEP